MLLPSYSLCRSNSLQEAEASFKSFVDVIPALSSSYSSLLTLEVLQEICSYLRNYPRQSLAHVAAHFGFVDCFKKEEVAFEAVNLVCPDTHYSPLHLAIKSGKILTVATIISLNPDFTLVDINGNNVLHLAASTSKEIITLVCSSIVASCTNPSTDGSSASSQQSSIRDEGVLIKLINGKNKENVSPIHLACSADKPECVKELLKNGADVNGACIENESGERVNQSPGQGVSDGTSCENNFDRLMIDHLDAKDMKNGGNPLHWAKSPQCMEPLIEMGCNMNAKNFQGETVLHVMISRNKLPCILTLLSYGADVNATGPNGNAPLHLSVRASDVTVVQALIVFGAKLGSENTSNESPRHLAATAKRSTIQDTILYTLHSVGARRCTRSSPASPCTDGCSPTGAFNGAPPNSAPFNRIKSLYDPLLGRSIVKAACKAKRKTLFSNTASSDSFSRKTLFSNTASNDSFSRRSPSKMVKKESQNPVRMETDECIDLTQEDEDESKEKKTARILCLDGGGIRGLVLIQMLSVLEDMMHPTPIYNCFDWIAGTSTGGILALVLATGHTAAECRQYYFRMKNKVFLGTRPYESEPLDSFLKKTLGEETRMGDILKPRVMLTATVGDKFPADLHLFRNYKSPDDILGYSNSSGSSHHSSRWSIPTQPSEDVLLWTAARSSGAAPTYFRPCGRYLDGGLISNNPTLDLLTEITQINAALDATVSSGSDSFFFSVSLFSLFLFFSRKESKKYCSFQFQPSEKITPNVVVSLGTGAPPVTDVPIIDVFRPDSLYGVAKIALMASSLGQLLIDQV